MNGIYRDTSPNNRTLCETRASADIALVCGNANLLAAYFRATGRPINLPLSQFLKD